MQMRNQVYTNYRSALIQRVFLFAPKPAWLSYKWRTQFLLTQPYPHASALCSCKSGTMLVQITTQPHSKDKPGLDHSQSGHHANEVMSFCQPQPSTNSKSIFTQVTAWPLCKWRIELALVRALSSCKGAALMQMRKSFNTKLTPIKDYPSCKWGIVLALMTVMSMRFHACTNHSLAIMYHSKPDLHVNEVSSTYQPHFSPHSKEEKFFAPIKAWPSCK